MVARFKDRQQAGRVLARKLDDYRDREDVVVLGIARGGIPVAYEVALALRAHLDVWPGHGFGAAEAPELTLGPELALADQIAILIDDGLGSGSNVRAAVRAARAQCPARVVLGVPIATPWRYQEISQLADEAVCLLRPEPFCGVGLWYGDFTRPRDEEVRDLLERAAQARAWNVSAWHFRAARAQR